MKAKGTWIFLGIVVLVVGIAAWDIISANKEQVQKQKDAYLVPHQGDHVQKISITTPDHVVEVEKSVDGWKLTKPINDWADSGAVQNFIFELTSAKSEKIVAEGEDADPKRYGLAPPAGVITVTLQNGENVTWEVGQNKSHEGNTYLRKAGESTILMARPDWAEWVTRKAFDFRDRRLFRGKIGSIVIIKIKTPAHTIQAEKKDNKWQIPGINTDSNRVHEFLTSLNQANAMEILAEGKIPENTKVTYLSRAPKYEITLHNGEKEWKALLNDVQFSAFAFVSDPPFLFKMEPSLIAKLKHLKPSSFRDKKEPLDFNKDAVREIDFQTQLKKQSFDATQVEMIALLESLKKLKILDFAKPATGLNNKIILKDQADKIIYEFSWGEPQKLKFDDSDKIVVQAKSNLVADSFYLEQSEIEKLNLQHIIKAEEENKDADKEQKAEK